MNPIITKLLSGATSGIVDSVAGVLDSVVTTDKDKLELKNKLTETVLSELNKVTELQSSILKAELTGNWLQRSWRPIVMLCFTFIVVYAYFIEPAFLDVPTADRIANQLNEKFWELLELGIGGYVIGRTVEKVSNTVSDKIDLSFLKKKDRK